MFVFSAILLLAAATPTQLKGSHEPAREHHA